MKIRALTPFEAPTELLHIVLFIFSMHTVWYMTFTALASHKILWNHFTYDGGTSLNWVPDVG